MLMSSYFKAMRQGQTDAFAVPTLEYPQSTELPVGFDNGSETATPRYREGTKIRLTPIDGISEWGTIIGHYFAYAHIVGCGCGATYSGWIRIQRAPLGSKHSGLGRGN
jgi:hypothetical protein